MLCQLGGWKAAQTVLQRYQRVGEDRLRKGSRGLPEGPIVTHLANTNSGHPTIEIRKSNGPG